MSTGDLVRQARRKDGLTQTQLAHRLGITQPAVARIEGAGDEVSVATLKRALNAMGRSLELRSAKQARSYDETLLRQNLELTPAERIHGFERFYADARVLAEAGARARAAA